MASVSDLSFDDLPNAPSTGASGLSFDDLPSAKPGMLAQFERQLGLTGRAALGGIGGLANIVLDPLVGGINSVAGTNLPLPSGAMERTLTRAGFPEPQTPTERIAQAGARAMIPGASVKSAAPVSQLVSSLLAGTSSQGAQEMGFGPFGQTIAGILGGIAVPTVAAAGTTGIRAASRIPGSIAAPFTEAGRKNTVARVYQSSATNPAEAAANIEGAPQFVPGVNPTTAEVANDPGLASLYKTLKTQNPAPFASAEAANDAARQAYLSSKFGSPADIGLAKEARDAVTGPMREAAFANAGPVDTAPIVASGNATLEAGAKYRGSGPLLQKFVDQISEINDPQVLYNGPRKAINDAIAGQVSKDSPLAQFTKQELIGLRGAIDNQIEAVAPGFKDYLRTHANLSRGIDAQQLGQDIAQSATNPQTERLSPAQFARQVSKNGPEIASAGPAASDVLMRVNEDLKRSVAPANAMRTAGSDTAQNLVGAEMLNRVLGHAPVGMGGRVLSKLASVVYGPFENQTKQLLLDAQFDPKLAAGLLRQRLPDKPDLTAGLLRQLLPISYGGLLGTISVQQ